MTPDLRAVYARIQSIRGMCTDGMPHTLIDRELVAVLDMLDPPKRPVAWTVRLGVDAWHVDTDVQAIDREDAIAQAQALHPEARTILGYWTTDRSGGNR